MTESDIALRACKQELNRLTGRLCTAIESYGLSRWQEEACKEVVKTHVHDASRHLQSILVGYAEMYDDGTEPDV